MTTTVEAVLRQIAGEREMLRPADPEMLRAVGVLAVARPHLFAGERQAEAWAVLLASRPEALTAAEVRAACIELARTRTAAEWIAVGDVADAALDARRRRRGLVARARYELEVQALAAGATPEEAQRQARAALGDLLPAPRPIPAPTPRDDQRGLTAVRALVAGLSVAHDVAPGSTIGSGGRPEGGGGEIVEPGVT